MARLRKSNLDLVLATLASGEAMSQSALVAATGLSAAAVSGLVAELSGQGRVEVREGVANGRRARLVSRSAGVRVFGAGIDIGRTHVRVVVGDQHGGIRAESYSEIPGRETPTLALDIVSAGVDKAVSDAGMSRNELAVISVATVSSLDPVSGAVRSGPAGSMWTDFPLVERLESATGLPVRLQNDANLGALALGLALGSERGILFIKVGTGIGAGLVVDGRLFTGNVGTVGEIGHLALDPSLAVTCECGRRGCLETRSSSEAVRRSFSTALDRELTMAEAVEFARGESPVALAVLDEAGTFLGKALGWIAQTINPAAIYLEGPFVSGDGPYLGAVRAAFKQSVWPAIFSSTVLDASPLEPRTVAVGALVSGLAAVSP